MTDNTEDLDAVIDRLSGSLGLHVPEARRPAVRAHLEISLGLAATVMAAKLPEATLENAPVFVPVARKGDPS